MMNMHADCRSANNKNPDTRGTKNMFCEFPKLRCLDNGLVSTQRQYQYDREPKKLEARLRNWMQIASRSGEG